MEVHHHTHPNNHQGRRKWTHYFWEFLMLFLAVFLGFMAENQREHFVERQRAKAYAQSLYNDLKKDTADLNWATVYQARTILSVDSLIDFVSGPGWSVKGGELYYYMRLAAWVYTVDFNYATMNQLINSGNLRYFTNTTLVSEISNYNTLVNSIHGQEQSIMEKRNVATTFRDQFQIPVYSRAFMGLSADNILRGKNTGLVDSLRKLNIPVKDTDKQKLDAFANTLVSVQFNRNHLLNDLYPEAIEEATNIMNLLKKEYRLE